MVEDIGAKLGGNEAPVLEIHFEKLGSIGVLLGIAGHWVISEWLLRSRETHCHCPNSNDGCKKVDGIEQRSDALDCSRVEVNRYVAPDCVKKSTYDYWESFDCVKQIEIS